MKQNVHPGVFVAIIAAVVAVAAVVVLMVYRTPPAAVASAPDSDSASSSSSRGAAKMAREKADHGGPTDAQKAQIEEWKKAHPGAYTRQ